MGAGYVSEPVVEYLTRDPSLSLTVVSALKNEADKLANKYKQTSPVLLDVTRSRDELEKLVKSHQCVISLLPYTYHASVAELCIKYKVRAHTTPKPYFIETTLLFILNYRYTKPKLKTNNLLG